jgi:hypothetical protein
LAKARLSGVPRPGWYFLLRGPIAPSECSTRCQEIRFNTRYVVSSTQNFEGCRSVITNPGVFASCRSSSTNICGASPLCVFLPLRSAGPIVEVSSRCPQRKCSQPDSPGGCWKQSGKLLPSCTPSNMDCSSRSGFHPKRSLFRPDLWVRRGIFRVVRAATNSRVLIVCSKSGPDDPITVLASIRKLFRSV